ncbi:MAG: hypothetical protein QM433_02130 [Euryarchaeota archaeon]|nr:hypothetical protein [Euryarchaeota archaeon]
MDEFDLKMVRTIQKIHRRGCRARGEWLIEHPKAFEPVRSELGEVFREAVHQW